MENLLAIITMLLRKDIMNNRYKALKHIGWSHNPSQIQNQPKSFPAPAHIDETQEKHETLIE